MHNSKLYKIKIENCPQWQTYDTCLLGISMEADCFEGIKLISLLNWINNSFKKCIILVADSLHRHNLMSEHVWSEDKAHEEALKMGTSWIERNRRYLDQIKVETILFRWDEWLTRKDVQNKITEFQRLYENKPAYKNAVDKDTQNFIARKIRRKEFIKDKKIFLQKSIDYLLEESAVDSVMAPKYPAVDAYPGPDLECQKIIRLESVPEAPDGMKYFARAEVKFKS